MEEFNFDLFSILRKSTENLEALLASSAVVATIAAFFVSSIGSVFSGTRSVSKESEPKEDLVGLVSGADGVDLSRIDFVDHTRLDELSILQIRFQRQARRNALSFNLLVLGQYIIGALLASSFVQESISKNLIGLLGVMVLLSAAVQQRFRPDILANQAKSRLTKCNRMIRRIEDGVFQIRTRAPTAPTLLSLRDRGSRALNELESDEFAGIEIYSEARREADDP